VEVGDAGDVVAVGDGEEIGAHAPDPDSARGRSCVSQVGAMQASATSVRRRVWKILMFF